MASGNLDILVAGGFNEPALDRLRKGGRVRLTQAVDEASLIRDIQGAQALVVRTSAEVTAHVIQAGHNLRVIGRGGVGLDNIDLRAAAERGVVVVHTPAASSDAVAEYTVGLMLALERHILTADKSVRQGKFVAARSSLIGRELGGLTLGIVGMGRIGQRVGRICANGFSMKVLYNDIARIEAAGFAARSADKNRLWSESDIVSLHVPLTSQTHGLIDHETLADFKPTATLINTSRGRVVDSAALADALVTGRLAGAALDVFDTEPLPGNHPLATAPNALLSPHVASRSHRGLARMNDVVDDVIAVLTGNPPKHPAVLPFLD